MIANLGPELRHWFLSVLTFYEFGIIAYLFTLSTIYFVLLLIGFFEMMRHRFAYRDSDENRVLEASPLVPPVSILAPAYNEATSIVESVRAMLALTYPEYEVIVINDGSKDDTLRLLIENFHLYRSARFYNTLIPGKAIRGVYESMDPVPLVVIDKENGGKADALNAGINVARYPLVCAADCDSLLESDALLRVARPFLEDPERVLAVGGIVRVANGCEVSGGRVLKVDLPRSWIGRCQVVEYLRSFLGGRVAFSAFNSLLIISGAFGLFSKKAVLAVGGYRTDTVGEDMELIVRLHRWARNQNMDYRIVFQPDPVCWTEVPESLKILKRQRNRWQRGSFETFWFHRDMICRPKYGGLGLFAFPYFILFETFGPLVELAGYALTLLGLVLRIFDIEVVYLFFLAAILYGMILSTASVILEELSTKRYPRVRNLLLLIVASLVENLGFRQLLTFWRAMAFVDVIRGKKSWGAMERKGLGTQATETPATLAPSDGPMR
jgi:cellulose synthase/poly-beta-1,6-N-acetylglucosamine synthase-like glycosyltransferase